MLSICTIVTLAHDKSLFFLIVRFRLLTVNNIVKTDSAAHNFKKSYLIFFIRPLEISKTPWIDPETAPGFRLDLIIEKEKAKLTGGKELFELEGSIAIAGEENILQDMRQFRR